MTRSKHSFAITSITCSILAVLAIAGPAAAQQSEDQTETPNPALFDAKSATEQAPDTFKVKMATTAGDLVIEVYREWAPHGADRFYNLVKIGYYNNVAFYRVLPGFMAQAGMNGDPKVSAVWLNSYIPADEVRQSNTIGRVSYAMGGDPGSRSAQFFINYGDNSYLDEMGFAPFGEVVEGFETVEAFYSGYGEGAPKGQGPDQNKLYRGGNAYLKGSFPKLDYIVSAILVE